MINHREKDLIVTHTWEGFFVHLSVFPVKFLERPRFSPRLICNLEIKLSNVLTTQLFNTSSKRAIVYCWKLIPLKERLENLDIPVESVLGAATDCCIPF